jgi:DNA (cytosine-5)-methyltransferase 1
MTYTVGSFCSGMDGIGLAFEQAGFRVRWHVEQNAFRRRVLKLRFPRSEIFEDVYHVGQHNLRPVTAMVGGFPCTPVSGAGKRKGTADERWIWPEIARIIGELRPRIVFLENADEICAPIRDDGRIIAPAPALEVLGSLAALRYDATWGIVPAAAVGAPHQRDRWWCVAHTDFYQQPTGAEQQEQCGQTSAAHADRHVSYANEFRQQTTKTGYGFRDPQWHDTAQEQGRWSECHATVASDQGVAKCDTPQDGLETEWRAGIGAKAEIAGTASTDPRIRNAECAGLERPNGQKLDTAAQLAQRLEGEQIRQTNESDLGRIVFDGLSRRLEQLASTERWAAPLGLQPYNFEPDRFTDDTTDWKDRVEAVGDSVCVPVVRAFADAIRQALETSRK